MQSEQQLTTQSIYEGKVVRLRVDKVALPSGGEAVREVVEHDAAVVIVPIDSEGNVLLVRQYRYPTEQTLLEAPAGVIEGSESPDDCAQRELQEEVGFASRSLRPMGGFWTTPGFCTEFMYAYLAKDLVPSKLDADDDEDIEVEKFPLSRVPQLIRLGEIQDAKTVAALLMTICLFENS